MTTDERFERIEHTTATLAEERRKDREEYKSLWRDTQRQLNELTANVNRNTLTIADTNELIHKLGERLDQTNATVDRLANRIDALVSAIGQNLSLEHRIAALEAAQPKTATSIKPGP